MSNMLDRKQDIGTNLFDVFQPYKIPFNLSQDYLDPVDGQVHRSQERCLGISTIQIGSQVYPNCTFFEMTESEISDVCSASSSPHQEDESVPESSASSLDGLASFALHRGMKRRKRRRTIRYDVIFTLDKKVSTLSNEHTFYAFPREAVTECLTTTAPHKLIFSCFPNTINKSLNCGCDGAAPVLEEVSFKTKLEEFAAVCSNRCKLTLPDQTAKIEGLGMSIIISKASNELHLSMKQLVTAYETMCQNAMNLIKSHNHEITRHKWTLLLPENTIIDQSECHLDKQEEEVWKDTTMVESTRLEMGLEQPQQYKPSSPAQKSIKKPSTKVKLNSAARSSAPTAVSAANLGKKCLYCGSKSTPMWRRGPQGAGTLCNACGVKWKHGKILIGNGTDTAIPAAVVSQDMKPKSEKKRKRLMSTNTPGNYKRSNNKKRHLADGYYHDEFAMPARREISHQQSPWEGQSTTSSSTDSCSPLESFTSSPNTSPSLLLSEQKRDISSLLSYDKESLSVYVGEDAVEAAALLTLLKRS